MYRKFLILLMVLLLPWIVTNVLSQDKQQVEQEDPHAGHDHSAQSEEVVPDEVDPHAGHDHAKNDAAAIETERAGNNDEAAGLTIKLTPEALRLAGITFLDVKQGRIGQTIELPGEIGFNEDRLVHVAPRFAGIALKANIRIGDYVKEGEVVAVIESNESMNSYSIQAPISGWVIERHITSGEYVSEENSIFVIADLTTVWVNLAVYPKDAQRIKKGQTALIETIGTNNITTGKIEYIMPMMDIKTRSTTARITLSNPANNLRPGSFVRATITTEANESTLVVEKNSVQYLDEKSVVFIADGQNRFTPVEVVIGESDDKFTQIISGLSEGSRYVSSGAFELKAKIVTSNLDAHAGHGH